MTEPDAHPAGTPPETLAGQCDEQRTRRSGPGGQHRNKTETAVVLTHRPTGVRAEAGEQRSQQANRKTAMRRLRLKLARQVRTERPDEPSKLWRSRCKGGRISVNPKHEDFAPLLAEALDHLAAAEWDPARVAEVLGCSTSQLIKLLKNDPASFELVNDRRGERGLHRLK